MHPQLDLVDELIRIFGYPTLLAAFVWAIRKYDAGQAKFQEISKNTETAVKGVAEVKMAVDTIQNNHLHHLQEGIDRVAGSNDEAVTVLREIKSGIDILKDRLPRS